MEIETPDGVVSRSSLPTIAPYAEERVSVDWTVPQDMDIGTSTLNFTVDPDQDVTADTNRTNNDASISIFVGRAPTADLFAEEGKYTFENVILNATQSFDVDGGDVDCRFEIESRAGLIDVIEAPNCITQWNWSNSGTWEVKVLVIDEELDTDELMVEVEILNRAPSFNLTYPEAGAVESPITIEAVDILDIDTTSPSGQQVTISWPGLDCAEGTTQPTCTITPMFEGLVNFTAVATDDDGETTTAAGTIEVLNVAPTLEPPQLLVGGEALQPDENGSWHLNEDEVALLRTTASDSENDQGTLIVEWYPSIDDQNWTITSIGTSSSEPVSWSTAGFHTIQVRAIDNDGESSDVQQASVIISNVPPTVTGLPGNTPVFEDDLLNLSVQISDTASDADSLEVCWDLNAKVDGNNDGVPDNDCELNGTSVSPSWTSVGVRMITVTVTDDDGATAQQSMNVSVLNLPPTALISERSVIEGLVEGDNITLGGEDSLETETDKTTLAYQWDSSHIDTDLDGKKTGDVDFSGPSWTIENLPAGTWTIVLTVIDDDGDSSQAELTILVAEAPPEGIFQSITDAVGSTMTAVIGLLGVVIFGLVLFLLFTRGGTGQDEDFGMYEQSSFATAPAQASASMAPVPTEQPAAAAPQPAAVARPNMDAQPVNTGPPLPASGLPNGWTMEQWNYYGEQWLAANQPAPAPVQPIVSQTQPAPASTELQSLLDDLDF